MENVQQNTYTIFREKSVFLLQDRPRKLISTPLELPMNCRKSILCHFNNNSTASRTNSYKYITNIPIIHVRRQVNTYLHPIQHIKASTTKSKNNIYGVFFPTSNKSAVNTHIMRAQIRVCMLCMSYGLRVSGKHILANKKIKVAAGVLNGSDAKVPDRLLTKDVPRCTVDLPAHASTMKRSLLARQWQPVVSLVGSDHCLTG